MSNWKNYEVTMRSMETYEVTVKARNEEEAILIALNREEDYFEPEEAVEVFTPPKKKPPPQHIDTIGEG